VKTRAAYAIIRLDTYLQGVAADADRVTVKRVMWDKNEAEAEAARLNALVGDDGQEYYVQYTRVDPE
jgi:hypothetical protein